MYVKRELMKGDPKQILGYEQMLRTYFPKRVQDRFSDDIKNHMLATEIATTVAITRVFADAGAAFFPMAIETTGSSVFEITQAYRKAQRVARMQEVRSALEELRTHLSLDTLYRSWVTVDAGAREVALYWLSTSGKIPSDDLLDEMQIAAERVYALQAADVVAANTAELAELRAQGIPDNIAALIQKAQYLNLALTVWAESRRSGEPSEVIAVRYLAIGRASGLHAILEDLQTRPATGRFDPLAMRILQGRFQTQLRELVGKVRVDVKGRTVDELEPELAGGVLADVRARVQEVLAGEANPSVATLLVLLERVTAAIARI
jgi:glutamate dehydrogenase